jgi:hypothetical protein
LNAQGIKKTKKGASPGGDKSFSKGKARAGFEGKRI